jgi:hypothetical protein
MKKKDLILPIQESVLSQAKSTETLKSRSQKYEI